MEAYALPEKGHYFRMDKNNSYFIQNGNVFAHEYIFCQSVPLHCFRHSHLTAAHRQNRLLKKFVQFPAVQLLWQSLLWNSPPQISYP